MADSARNDVDAPSIAYRRMADKWRLIDDLTGGTATMRAAREERLPRETKEKPSDYSVRLNRSILYAALADTIDKTSARPFSRPVTLQGAEALPDPLLAIEDDADLGGSNLTELGRSAFIDGLKYGKWHLLVDFPAIGRTMSLLEERAGGVRPYFARISPTDLIGWRSERSASGGEVLTQVRIKERRVEGVGAYGEEEVERVRVYTREGWEVWRRGENEDWTVVERGAHTLGEVPLVTVYFNRVAFLESAPPFEDLAWLNLAHWQSYSDQRNLLRVARVPILTATGISQKEYDQGITVGTSNLLKSTNPDAEFSYVEHSGSALGAGEADLKSLEERMEVLGLQPLISRSGGVTATAKSMDEARSESNIQAWIRASEAGLRQAYEMAAGWIRSEVPEEFAVDIYSEFGLSLKSAEDVQTLLSMYSQGVITAETLLTEIKRRGILSEMVDAEEEAQAARDAVPLGLLSSGAEDDGDDDPDGGEEPIGFRSGEPEAA